MPIKLESLTITELKEKCKKKGIKGYSSLCKKDLVKKLGKKKVSKKKSKKSMKGGVKPIDAILENNTLKITYENGSIYPITIDQTLILNGEIYQVTNITPGGIISLTIKNHNGLNTKKMNISYRDDMFDSIVTAPPTTIKAVEEEIQSEAAGNASSGNAAAVQQQLENQSEAAGNASSGNALTGNKLIPTNSVINGFSNSPNNFRNVPPGNKLIQTNSVINGFSNRSNNSINVPDGNVPDGNEYNRKIR